MTSTSSNIFELYHRHWDELPPENWSGIFQHVPWSGVWSESIDLPQQSLLNATLQTLLTAPASHLWGDSFWKFWDHELSSFSDLSSLDTSLPYSVWGREYWTLFASDSPVLLEAWKVRLSMLSPKAQQGLALVAGQQCVQRLDLSLNNNNLADVSFVLSKLTTSVAFQWMWSNLSKNTQQCFHKKLVKSVDHFFKLWSQQPTEIIKRTPLIELGIRLASDPKTCSWDHVLRMVTTNDFRFRSWSSELHSTLWDTFLSRWNSTSMDASQFNQASSLVLQALAHSHYDGSEGMSIRKKIVPWITGNSLFQGWQKLASVKGFWAESAYEPFWQWFNEKPKECRWRLWETLGHDPVHDAKIFPFLHNHCLQDRQLFTPEIRGLFNNLNDKNVQKLKKEHVLYSIAGSVLCMTANLDSLRRIFDHPQAFCRSLEVLFHLEQTHPVTPPFFAWFSKQLLTNIKKNMKTFPASPSVLKVVQEFEVLLQQQILRLEGEKTSESIQERSSLSRASPKLRL